MYRIIKYLFNIPVFPLEKLHEHIDLKSTGFYCAVVYTQLNRLRTRLMRYAKGIGLTPVSYISSRARC